MIYGELIQIKELQNKLIKLDRREVNVMNIYGKMFKELSIKDEIEYRQWSRDNYKARDQINIMWHPVIREECMKMCREARPLSSHEREIEEIDIAEAYAQILQLCAFSYGTSLQENVYHEFLQTCLVEDDEFPEEIKQYMLKASAFEIVQMAYHYYLRDHRLNGPYDHEKIEPDDHEAREITNKHEVLDQIKEQEQS